MSDATRRLEELGLADLSARFDPERGLVRDPFRPERHSPHHSIWYAIAIADSDPAAAERIADAALELQERRTADPHYGNFRWHAEDEGVYDLNAAQFVLEALIRCWRKKSLSDELRTRITKVMPAAFGESEQLDVHWTYTNIYLLDVHNCIIGGELLGDRLIVERGQQRLAEWWQRTKAVGVPHEFNSPTYAAVDLNCLADIANHADDASVRDLALEAEQFVWRHIATHWHAGTMQLAGPHSRAYRRDVVGASGFLKVVLYKLLGDERLLAPSAYYDGPDAEGHLIVAGIDYHCPPDAEEMLRTPASRTFGEVVAAEPHTDAVTQITPTYSLGTMSRPYGVGDPPEHWPASNPCIAYWQREESPGYGVLYTRYRSDGGPVGEPSREKVPRWMDIWEEGVFRIAQNGSRAIIAYGLRPKLRPTGTHRLDIRVLGPDAVAFRIGGKSWDGTLTEVKPGTVVTITDGETLIGIIPLEPTRLGHSPAASLWRDGDATMLSIMNYEGPPRGWWEYRSLSGPFWKGNVRNGFALWIADRSEYADVGAFERMLAETPLRDTTDGTMRHISFGDVELTYDLRELRD